jgi:hypothetical protein
VLQQELGALESFRQLLADGLLDDAGAGESDESAGFGDVEVAQHGEAGGDASGGGVGEDGDEGDAGLVEAGERGGDLGELHEADDAFHHAGSAGRGDGDEGVALVAGAVDGAGDGFADDGAHAAADEAVLHDGEDDGVGSEETLGVDDGVVEAGVLAGFFEARLVGLEVGELERIGGLQVAVDDLEAGAEEGFDAGEGADAAVASAFGADLEIGFELGLPDGLAAAVALGPEAFGADAIGAGLKFVVFAPEPGHGGSRRPRVVGRQQSNRAGGRPEPGAGRVRSMGVRGRCGPCIAARAVRRWMRISRIARDAGAM